MFTLLLVVLVVAAVVHLVRSPHPSRERGGRLLLLYLLVGYCGVPMVVVAGAVLLAPARAAEVLGFPPDNPFQAFLGWAYLGMALTASLGLLYRDRFLVGPAIGWAVFFTGATVIHLRDYAARGALTHGGLLEIVLAHGLVSVLLVGGLVTSGLLRRPADPGPTRVSPSREPAGP